MTCIVHVSVMLSISACTKQSLKPHYMLLLIYQNYFKEGYTFLGDQFSKVSTAGQNSRQPVPTCHFLTIDRSLSVVRSIPWKFVRTFLPCTSSAIRRNLRNERSASLSFCRSAKDTSNTLYFKPSDAISKKVRFKHKQ